MAEGRQRISTLVVDGESHTEGTYGQDRIQSLPYLVATTEGLQEETVFGFTSEDVLELWAREAGLDDDYRRVNELHRRVRPAPSSEEEAQHIFRAQAQVVNDATRRFEETLRRHKIQPSDIDKIVDLAMNFDPLEGPILQSLVLWRHCDYGGDPRVIPSGYAIPDFRWIFFNDTASSALHFGAAHMLCQDSWFRPRRVYFFGVIRADCFVDYPWYFNDVASSAVGI